MRLYMSTTILIVDSDILIHEQLKEHRIDKLAIKWLCAFTAQQALAILEEKLVDVILTELNLPDMSGFAFLHQAQHLANVIVYTHHHDEQVILRAFDEGVDDFIIKANASIEEVFLRLQAILRRKMPDFITLKHIHLDIHARRAWWKGTELQLNRQSFAFLLELVKHPNTICGKDQLLAVVSTVNYRMLYIIAYDIRQQIETDSSRPRYLLNIRSTGYMLKI